MSSKTNTLLITGGRVIDPSSGMDRDMDVLLREGRVAERSEERRVGKEC